MQHTFSLYEDGPLRGGLSGKPGMAPGEEHAEPERPERPREGHYAMSLERKLAQIKHRAALDDPNNPEAASAGEIASELMQLINTSTNWSDKGQATKGKNAQLAIYKIMGARGGPTGPQTVPPHFPPSHNDYQAKLSLVQFGYNQLLKWMGLQTMKSGPTGHQAPVQESSPTLGALEILATSDRAVFEHVMDDIGLPILGIRRADPLNTQALPEDIESIAAELTESADEFADLDPYLAAVKQLAEALGFIVGIAA